MSTDFNVVVDIGRADPAKVDLDPFVEHHGVVAGTTFGTVEIILTVPAEDVRQASATGWSIVKAAGHEPQALTAMTTADFDLRWGQSEPATLTVTQAAQLLGVTPQAVRQRLDAGTLPGQRIGRDWRIPANAVRSRAAERSLTMPVEHVAGIPVVSDERLSGYCDIHDRIEAGMRLLIDQVGNENWRCAQTGQTVNGHRI